MIDNIYSIAYKDLILEPTLSSISLVILFTLVIKVISNKLKSGNEYMNIFPKVERK